MANASVELKRQIISDLNISADATEAGQIEILWDFYSYYDNVSNSPMLTYLYTKRAMINVLLGRKWTDVTWAEGGVNQSNGERFNNLKTLWEQTTQLINEAQANAAALRGGAIGQMSQVAPIMQTDPGLADPNSPAYQGSPMYPLPWRGSI